MTQPPDLLASSYQAEVDPILIRANPDNPRRYFNEERLDLLRTSIQEVGILVPLIVYQDPETPGGFVLMDGERRWRCSMDIGLTKVPTNVIPTPDPLDNLLRMFNIHNVREDWPLISVALSLREVMKISGETGEKRLAEMTGVTRSSVRRARRLLSLPENEIDLIRREAHLDRSLQVHREDLYLEIEAAESVLRAAVPSFAAKHTRAEVIRAFAAKAEARTLRAVTDFRLLARLSKAIESDSIDSDMIEYALDELVSDVSVTPQEVFDNFAAEGYRQQTLIKKAEVLADDLSNVGDSGPVSPALFDKLRVLHSVLTDLLGSRS
ncbi:ParB family chromosome partitioning protein [Microbacterium sp. SORGH_AS428]|uniref:ParB/RepB/Spo0J family partition protein n=1 Tax=Microbacterium sp. SORGH_AS_0428 TaxID=3041788 RepID=UPI002855223A|nr:ParB/RepB/Spo0J family partition protein [Microbacterium sp. SORGH_AS_0428]MDR6201057.1 ParB family chromosome partitioning protein [Microbacterium sp. SORGH_AS_0428]